MPKNRVVVPTSLPIVLRHCHRCASGRFRANGEKIRADANRNLFDAWPLNLLHDNGPGLAAELLRDPVVRRREVGGPGRVERPAWQSPYGPPPHRAYRGRWAPSPAPARSRSAVRRGHLCGRCD